MANTYSSSLVTQVLEEQATTILTDLFAPLNAFAQDFRPDPIKPLAVAQAKFVTAGATTQTNATNFESGDSTVTNVQMTPNQITTSFHVSNAELNSGLRLADLVKVNLRTFANSVMSAVLAPVTVANFTANTPLVCASGAFGFNELSTLWGQLKKSPEKNVLLDGPYLARIINQPTFYQKTGTDGSGGGWRAFGWDGVFLNTNWTGTNAGDNVVGFAAGPQAVGVLAGPPLDVPSNTMQREAITIPDLNLTVAAHLWFALSSRTAWMSFDLVVGASLLDATAGVIIKSQ